MFKKIFAVTAILTASVMMAGAAYGQYCGGTIVENNDCNHNSRSYAASCCPSGYRVQGIAYDDMQGTDDADAYASVCRHVVNGNIRMPSDFRGTPIVLMCDKTEVFAGVACKDSGSHGGGKNSDASDGCTAICQKPGGEKRFLYNADTENNNKRSYSQHTVDLPNRVVGILYKDMSNAVDKDRADCVTISYAHQPIVK